MSKFFDISYILDNESADGPQDIIPVFIKASLTDASGQEEASKHELWLDLYHGFLDESEDSSQQAVSHTRYAIFSDDLSEFGLEDSKGNQDLPVFLVNSNSVVSCRIEGIYESELLIRMGQDMADCHDAIINVMSFLQDDNKAFMYSALSMFEQSNAAGDVENLLTEFREYQLADILETLITFYMASLSTNEEQSERFKDFFTRLHKVMEGGNKRADIRLLN